MSEIEPRSGTPQAWIWLQLVIGWIPMWGLFAAMIVLAHGTPWLESALRAFLMVLACAPLSPAVHRLTARMPWPHPFRLSFAGVHLLAAGAYACGWIVLYCGVESLMMFRLVLVSAKGIGLFLITGTWLYVMVAAIAYATQAAARGARIEADAARAQLAALRAQLHPHFLFNALHAVVQLIPVDPRRAVQAAEQLADLLRTSLEEQRDRVTLAEEWSFVERYLAIEYLRFGERLACTIEINPETRAAQLPSFALQTLVENAVRHGASPRVEPTQVTISAGMTGSLLTLVVHDDGQAADLEKIATSAGTGLRRLRDRLERLYGVRARLDLAKDSGGFSATLIVPQEETGDDD